MYSIGDDYADTSMDVSIISDSLSFKEKQNKDRRSVCAICGAKPSGINFDVMTVNKKSLKIILYSLLLFSVHHAKHSFEEMVLDHQ
jgi:hypothetical protein